MLIIQIALGMVLGFFIIKVIENNDSRKKVAAVGWYSLKVIAGLAAIIIVIFIVTWLWGLVQYLWSCIPERLITSFVNESIMPLAIVFVPISLAVIIGAAFGNPEIKKPTFAKRSNSTD